MSGVRVPPPLPNPGSYPILVAARRLGRFQSLAAFVCDTANMIRIAASTALICLLALSAGGCAVELPGSALTGFRLAPPDAGKTDVGAEQRQVRKPIAAH